MVTFFDSLVFGHEVAMGLEHAALSAILNLGDNGKVSCSFYNNESYLTHLSNIAVSWSLHLLISCPIIKKKLDNLAPALKVFRRCEHFKCSRARKFVADAVANTS